MNQTTDRFKTQVLIIGSGIAGSTAALQLAEMGMEITLLTSGNDLDDGNTALAQGGIVYQGKEEIPQHLEQDIFSAGWQCNYHRAVRYLSRKGPDIVKQLLLDKLQIPFEREENNAWKLVKEGGHSQARVLYCADYTGKAIMDGLMQAVKQEPNIKILTNRTAIDLLTSHHHSTTMEYRYHLTNRCVGAYVFNQYFNQVETILADFTLLTTGGIGQIYLHTTNTASSIGSGLTMAFRAGAKVMNMEYIQFHPTSLFHRAERRFLISEAVRGEGAKLINSKGERFMTKYDHRADLAPRDIVTRAIVDEMLHSGEPCVYLDVANYFDQDAASRFPTIYKKCKEIGIDMAKDPIPVVPAAHYFCGGILVNIQGRTTLERLYAAGECSCTGVHGANRLASTSLLEGILWGWSAARDINKRIKTQGDQKTTLSKKLQQAIPDWVNPGNKNNEDPALIAQDWATIRHTMWNYVGISRPTSRLKRAFEDLQSLNVRLHDFYRQTPISKPLVDLFHGCQSAYIVTQAALRNKTSLGCHYRPGK
jgi:L-aspartate oxidase